MLNKTIGSSRLTPYTSGTVWHGMAWRGRAGQGRAALGRAGLGRVGQGRAGTDQTLEKRADSAVVCVKRKK